MVSVCITPHFEGVDLGDGGIRRVVEAQRKWLPTFGIDVVDEPKDADILAMHAGAYIEPINGQLSVAHCHGLYWADYDWQEWTKRANDLVVKSILSADLVTAPSKWVAHAIERGTWRKAEVLYHGIDPNSWQPDAEHSDYVLWNKTRVDAICDPQWVVQLAQKVPAARFISTFGPTKSNLEITGALPFTQAKQLVQGANVYLCTSRETFGLGTLEAMLCGVPILGFNYGGQAEFVKHKEHGYLAKPGDIDDLVDGLIYCLENRDALSEQARQYVLDNFTWDHIIERYATIYNTLYTSHDRSMAVSKPKISVVIPSHNLEQYLAAAVDSIMGQKDIAQKDVEVLIVDDASTDDSLGVANDLAAAYSNVKVIHNEENLYLAGTLNKGILAARGDYIVPLDADNMLGSRALSLLSQALDNDQHIDIAYGSMQLITENGEPATQYGQEGISTWPYKTFNFKQQLEHRNQIPSTSMYRKKVWLTSGGYRRRNKTAEDAEFWCRVTSLGFKPAKVTDAVTLIYRDRPDSMSHVNKEQDWTAWFPWSKQPELTPCAANPINALTYDPVIVSVIIPVGPGHTELLVDAVDSIIAQTYQKWEVIVVNDSGEALLTMLPPFVRVINTTGKVGPAAARNAGIKESKGRVFILLDADDYLEPTCIAKLLRAYNTEGPKTYIYTDWVINENQEAHESWDWNVYDLLRQMPHAVTALYPRALFDDTGGFDEELAKTSWEDWDFLIAAADAGYCGVRYPEPLLFYRMSTGTIRETKYADKEVAKTTIYNKWKRYIDNPEVLAMGCGCGGSGVHTIPLASGMSASADMMVSTTGMQLLRFTKQGAGVMTINGPRSRRAYRFGSDEDHVQGYVFNEDVEELLRLPYFELVTEENTYARPG